MEQIIIAILIFLNIAVMFFLYKMLGKMEPQAKLVRCLIIMLISYVLSYIVFNLAIREAEINIEEKARQITIFSMVPINAIIIAVFPRGIINEIKKINEGKKRNLQIFVIILMISVFLYIFRIEMAYVHSIFIEIPNNILIYK